MRPFNAVYVVAYKANSNRQNNGNTEIHSSVQCFCTQRRPVEPLVKFVESDYAAVSGLYSGIGSSGHALR